MRRNAPDRFPDDEREVVTRIGRPRANGAAGPARSPRDEIVAVATRLFADQGFDQTTMSEIARAAGLQQSSLYYWFKRKELILQAVFAVNRTPLEFIERIGAGSGSPALKLYRLIRFDTIQLCESPCDVLEVGPARGPPARALRRLLARPSASARLGRLARARGRRRGRVRRGRSRPHRARAALARRRRAALGSARRAAPARRRRRSSGFPRFTSAEAGDFAATTALRSLLQPPDDARRACRRRPRPSTTSAGSERRAGVSIPLRNACNNRATCGVGLLAANDR